MATTDTQRLIVSLEARISAFEKAMNRANGVANSRVRRIEKTFADMNKNVAASFAVAGRALRASASTTALSIGQAFASVGAYLSTQQLAEYANAWTRMERVVSGGQQTFGIALKSASELTDLANDSRVDLEAYGKLYVRTSAAIRDYGFEAGTAEKVTSTLAKALKLGGTTASEQESVLLQFSQALQKGKLDGDEFRTVMENAGIVQELLADRLGVTKGEIINLAKEGKLAIPDLVGAMVDGGAKIERIFKQMPATIDEAFTVLRNNMVRYIGNVDQATGASSKFTDAIGVMGRNIETVAGAAAVLGAALLASFGGGALRGVIALAARLATLPAILAAAGVGAVTFGSEATLSLSRLTQALDQGAGMADALNHAMNDSGAGATTVSDQFRGLAAVLASDLLAAVNGISAALGGQEMSWDQIKGYALLAIGGIVGALKSIPALAAGSFKALALTTEVAFKEIANRVIRIINWISEKGTEAINAMNRALNKLPGFDFKMQTPDIIKEFDTAGAYASARDLSAALTRGLEDNFDLKGFANRVDREAQGIAMDRLLRQWKPGEPFDLKQGKAPGDTDEDRIGARSRRRFENELTRTEGDLRMRELERDSIGKTALETERLRVKTDLLNAAREAGVKLTDEDRLRVDALSEAMARAAVQTDNMREAYESMRSESQEFLSTFIKGLKDGQSATDLLVSGLDRIADRLIDMAVQDLVDAALGGLTGRGGAGQAGGAGSLASGFAGLFGFAAGGIFRNGRPVSLPRFARGGISRSAAIFGEAGPEAAVPLPDGRSIPVNLRLPEMPRSQAAEPATVVTVAPVFNVQNGSPEGVAKMRREIVPLVQNTIKEMFDRNPRFARSRI